MKQRIMTLAAVLAATFVAAAPVFAADTYEPNNSFETAAALPYNAYINSYVSTSADVDYFKVYGGRLTAFELVNPEGADYDIYLYDTNFNLVSSSETTEQREAVGYYVPTYGNTYYVKVVGKNGAYDPDRPYVLRQIYNLYY